MSASTRTALCIMLLYAIIITSTLAIQNTSDSSSEIQGKDVYHAYYRQINQVDNGTIHLFISNSSTAAFSVDKIRFNMYTMTDMPNQVALWYKVTPCIVQPGEVADLAIRLRKAIYNPIKLYITLSNGKIISASIDPFPAPLRITFIGFDKDKVYVYFQNTGEQSVTITDLMCNLQDITGDCYIPEPVMLPGSKSLIVFKPDKPLKTGAYYAFKIKTREDITAAAISRNYSYFPITAFGKENRTELGFDRNQFAMKYPGDKSGFETLLKEPAFKAYHLFDDPVCADGNVHKKLGDTAREVVSRGDECYKHDPVHPNLIFCCEYNKPYSYSIYAETSDIVAFNPYEMHYFHKQPLENSKYIAYAKLASEPRLMWTLPEAFANKSNLRFPTPEEERLIVYSEIGEGSKGIWYFTYDKTRGYQVSPPLEAEIGKINRELRLLRDYISISEPFNLVKVNVDKVRTYSLLCGDKAVLLLLLNADHRSSSDAQKFTYTPKENVEIICRIPSFLKVMDVSEIVTGKAIPLKYTIRNENEMVLSIDRLDISKQILVRVKRK